MGRGKQNRTERHRDRETDRQTDRQTKNDRETVASEGNPKIDGVMINHL